MYNSKYNTIKIADASADEPDFGLIPIDQAGNRDNHMWSRTMESWRKGTYPKISQYPGLPSDTPFSAFPDSINSTIETLKQRHETRKLKKNVKGVGHDYSDQAYFGGIKHLESGRHFGVTLFWDGDSLKAKTVIDRGINEYKANPHVEDVNETSYAYDPSHANAHDEHIYDLDTGKWHLPGENPSLGIDGYNPIDLIEQAPADLRDSTRSWKQPPPSLGFCTRCKRFPKKLKQMLELMRPTKCTTCGQTGRHLKYPYENAQHPEGAQSSAFRQASTPVCQNIKCDNYNKSVASQPAFVDKDFNIIYPGAVDSNGKIHYPGVQQSVVHLMTQGEHQKFSEELHHLTTVGRSDIAKKIEAARELGDLRENGDYNAAKDEQGKMEARIRDLSDRLTSGKHRIISDDEARDIDSRGESRQSRSFDNPQFNARINAIGTENVFPIQLPMSSLVCDHKDCSCAGDDIRTHVDLDPSISTPCSHCGRDQGDGVELVQSPEGYTRCNPLIYGVNKCAPLPKGSLTKFLEWFKPDPTHAFPKSKTDEDTGITVLFDKLFPGLQAVRTRRKAPFKSPTRGIENPDNYFDYGDTHKPWKYLGMDGREISQVVGKKINSEFSDDLDKEKIQPGDYTAAIKTPLIGDPFNEYSDLAIELSKPESLGRKPYVDQNGQEHPEITQDDYDNVFPTTENFDNIGENQGRMLRGLTRIFRKDKEKFPIAFRDSTNEKRASEGVLNDEYQSPTTLDDMGSSSSDDLESWDIPWEEEPKRYDTPSSLGIMANEKVECPECKGESIINRIARYFDDRCKGCINPADHRSHERTKGEPHCAHCVDNAKCEDKKHNKRRIWWNLLNKGVGAVCRTCDNWGEISLHREHCATCNGKNCGGANDYGSNHCEKCSRKNDKTPGYHAKLEEANSAPVNLGDNGSEETRPLFETGETRKAVNEELLRTEPNYRFEGVNPDLLTPEQRRKLTETHVQGRLSDVESGLVQNPTALENLAIDLDRGSLLSAIDSSDPGISSAVSRDIEQSKIETSPFLTTTRFDSPQRIFNIEEALDKRREEGDGAGDDDDDLTSIPWSSKVIEHDRHCRKCNNGIVDPAKISSEEMAAINTNIGKEVAKIRTMPISDDQKRIAIEQATFEGNLCRG